MSARKRKPASKPRSWRVFVRPDVDDELRRYGSVLGYKRHQPGEGSVVRATLTLDPPQRAPKKGRK